MPRRNNRFNPAHTARIANAKPVSRFQSVPRSLARNRSDTQIVYLFDDMMVFNASFGRFLDSQQVETFCVLADDVAQELAIKVFSAKETQAMGPEEAERLGLFVLRPNRPEPGQASAKNAGRRVKIRYLQEGRAWLRRDMVAQEEHQKRRFPQFDAQEQLYVLKKNL